MISFCEAFQCAFSSTDYSMKEVSELVSSSSSYLYRIMSGTDKPSERMMRKIMNVITFPIDYNIDVDLLRRGDVPAWLQDGLEHDNNLAMSVARFISVHSKEFNSGSIMRVVTHGL